MNNPTTSGMTTMPEEKKGCEHLWETQYAKEVAVPDRERESTYSPVTRLKTFLICQKKK